MLVNIIITVDINELEIDATFIHDELTTEYWGNVSTERWTEVEINNITYNGQDAELVSDIDEITVQEHVLANWEDYS